MKRIIIGFFNVDGSPDSVETEVVGSPKREYAELNKLIHLKYPKVPASRIKRTGSHIELRDGSRTAPIKIGSGRTVGQLFDADSTLLHVGRAFFETRPVNIFLSLSRASGRVSIQLQPLLKTDGPAIPLPNKFSANRVAEELPEIVESSLGAGSRAVQLRFVKG